MKCICVICDYEPAYAAGIMEYINRRKTLPFTASACTSGKSLLSFAQKTPIDILLVSESMFNGEIEEIPAVSTIILDEGLERDICAGYRMVYKYQACDAMIRELLNIFSSEQSAVLEFGKHRAGSRKILGVYSPCGGCLKTTFSLALSQVIAEKKKVLFADINAFSGLDILYDMPPENGLSDLLYYGKAEDPRIMTRLASMVCVREGVDMIPPLSSPEDLFGTEASSYRNLFETIMEKGVYDVLVLDIGLPSFELMDICTTIYVPYARGDDRNIKINAFETMLSSSRYREVLQKTEKVSVPDFRSGNERNDIYGKTEAVKTWIKHEFAGKGETDWD